MKRDSVSEYVYMRRDTSPPSPHPVLCMQIYQLRTYVIDIRISYLLKYKHSKK